MIIIMKKLLLSIVLLLASSFSDVIAQNSGEYNGDEIILHTSIIDPTKDNGPIRRSPIHVPSISIDDHTLFFNSSCDGCTLRLYNEEVSQ